MISTTMVRAAHESLRAALALVSLLLTGVVVFGFDVVVDRAAALAAGVVLALVILVLWVVVPAFLRRRAEEDPR